MDNYYWVNIGTGGFKEQKIEKLGGGTLNAGFSFLNKRIIERRNTVRKANDLVNIKLAGYINNGDEHTYAVYYDFGILYGKTAGDEAMLFVCAGVGLIGGMYHAIGYRPYPPAPGGVIPAYLEYNFKELNFPIEAGINLNSHVIGVGITGFANINRTQPMLGLRLDIQIGKISEITKTQ